MKHSIWLVLSVESLGALALSVVPGLKELVGGQLEEVIGALQLKGAPIEGVARV